MKTRKEINDKYGCKSLYVIECCFYGGEWFKIWVDGQVAFLKRNEATKAKEKKYKTMKKIFPKSISRKNYRIALYMRAE